jgi:hypothetical protein
MPLHVFGCMEEQSLDGRRQLLSPDHARGSQSLDVGAPQLIQCIVHLRVKSVEQIIDTAS